MSAIELAPAAIVRVASWPADLLDELQEPVLAELAATVSDASDAGYRRAYDEAIDRERGVLARLTVDDPRFRCALALASPGLAAVLEQWPDALPPRTKRVRHVETSLLRYLARAVGRSDPAGLWAGVTLARWGEREATTFVRRDHHVRVTPELQPFRRVFELICAREPYRRRGRFRVNPTLARRADGWRLGRRASSGAVEWIDLPESPLWELLHDLGDGEAHTLPELERALARRLGDEVGAAAIELGRKVGVLIGGLAFPARFGSSAEALALAAEQLHGDERQTWERCRDAVMKRCEGLAAGLAATMDGRVGAARAQDVLHANDAVRTAIADMIAALDVPAFAIPAAMLRVDLVAPFHIELGHADRREVRQSLDDWEATHRRSGGLRRYARRVALLLGARSSMPLFDPSDDSPRELELDDRAPSSGAPFGALVLRPAGPRRLCGWLRGVSDSPTATHARHADALASVGDPLLPWFRRRFAEITARTGIEIVDLASDGTSSPNVAARPRYVPRVLRPWGIDDVGLDRSADFRRGPTQDAPVVVHAGRRLAAFVFSAAAIPSGDPVLSRLLATSFSALADRYLPASDVGPDETSFRERSKTDGGRDVTADSTWLSIADCRALARVRGAERFRVWSRIARVRGWPDIVRVARANRTPLLVAVHSPLAVEALLEGFRGEKLAIEEVLDGGWAAGEYGRCRAELVVPIFRRDNQWCEAGSLEVGDVGT